MDRTVAHVAAVVAAALAVGCHPSRGGPVIATERDCVGPFHEASGHDLDLVALAYTEILRQDMANGAYSGPGVWSRLRASGEKMFVGVERPEDAGLLTLPEPESAFERADAPDPIIGHARKSGHPAHYIAFLRMEASGDGSVIIEVTAGTLDGMRVGTASKFWQGAYCAKRSGDGVVIAQMSRGWFD